MSRMSKADWKKYSDQWKKAGPMLDRVKRRELKNLKYDFAAVDALLKIGDRFGKSRPTSGMVEMQKGLKKLAELQGFLPEVESDGKI